MAGHVYFISGIDTGVGKTVVTGLLARWLRATGRDVITVKMVQTGNTGFSEDLDAHRELSGMPRFPEDDLGLTAPQIFAFPSSPELAARLEGRTVDLEKIAHAVATCAAAHEVVLVEGAGGLAVPLTAETLSVDFAAAQGWPLILVASGRLGSINHIILSLEAAKARGMSVAGVVYNWSPDADPMIDADTPAVTRRALERLGFPPVLIKVSKQVRPVLTDDIDFSPLFATHGRAASMMPPYSAVSSKPPYQVSHDGTANGLLAFDRAHIWHPYASVANPPPVRFVKEAHGVNLVLHDGSTLVDAVSSWWCVAHGHSHPHIVEAMRRQSERLSHVMFGGLTHEPAIALAERLVQLTPPDLDRVFFADSGSISVEVAAKMAVQYQHARGFPRKGKLVALLGGYHGDTCCAMALSDPDGMHTLFRSIMPQHYFADPLDFNSLVRVVEEHGDEIAGVICEPYFQAANAMRFYSPDYLRQMRALCDEKELLLIFDEIAAGFHRTGPRWAHERAGSAPDILCVGKALTGGHVTLAATIASTRVAETISSGSPGAFMHGPTYMANPIACAAGLASLDLFEQTDYAAAVARIEGELRDGLAPCREMPNVADVRVSGAVGIVEVKDALPAQADIDRVITRHGVWLRPFSRYIYTMPPLVSDTATIGRITAAIRELAACPAGPVPEGDFHE